jgi:hypothetical protein
MKATTGEYRSFKLHETSSWINWDRLTAIEREHPYTSDYANNTEKGSGKDASKGKKSGKQSHQERLAATQCLSCGGYGHMARFCPQGVGAQQALAVQQAFVPVQTPPFSQQPTTVPPQAALGNGGKGKHLNTFAKGQFNQGKGKKAGGKGY